MTRAGRLTATIAATLDSGHTRMLIVFFGFQSARRAGLSNDSADQRTPQAADWSSELLDCRPPPSR
jgi:hypothetical protein